MYICFKNNTKVVEIHCEAPSRVERERGGGERESPELMEVAYGVSLEDVVQIKSALKHLYLMGGSYMSS